MQALSLVFTSECMALNQSLLTAVDIEQQQVMAAQQNLQAFAPLYEKYHAALCRFAYQRLSDKEEVFEMVSLSFLKAMQNIGKYKNEGLPFGSWLYRIVLNEINMQHRSGKTQRVINCDENKLSNIAEVLQENFDNEKIAALKQSLETLNPYELDLIEMRFFEQRGFKEIAAITGQQEAAVKMRCYRSLDKLKVYITKNKTVE
jgi:RNA polymerase sigma-70 factor, ECF subfamily